MKDPITKYIAKQRVANICCIDVNEKPYCFSCYFAYVEAAHAIVFKTSLDTHHAKSMLMNHVVAGTVLPDKLSTVHVQGIQFEGVYLLQPTEEIKKLGAAAFYKKYPFAKAMPGELWIVQLDHIKFTDSTLGIGKKLEWSSSI